MAESFQTIVYYFCHIYRIQFFCIQIYVEIVLFFIQLPHSFSASIQGKFLERTFRIICSHFHSSKTFLNSIKLWFDSHHSTNSLLGHQMIYPTIIQFHFLSTSIVVSFYLFIASFLSLNTEVYLLWLFINSFVFQTKCKFHKNKGFCLFCLFLYPQHLKSFVTPSTSSRNISNLRNE